MAFHVFIRHMEINYILFYCVPFFFYLSAIITSTIVVSRNWIPFLIYCFTFLIYGRHCLRPFTKEPYGIQWSWCEVILLLFFLPSSHQSLSNIFIFLFSLFPTAISTLESFFFFLVSLCFMISKVEKEWVKIQPEKLKAFFFETKIFHEALPYHLIIKKIKLVWFATLIVATVIIQILGNIWRKNIYF